MSATRLQVSALRHSEGVATPPDILLAEGTLRESQTQYLQTLVEYLKAQLALKKAAGAIRN